MNVGDRVRIKQPFNVAYPNVYTIIAVAVAPDTYTLDTQDGGGDFYIDYLEAV
jgi:hypothetical protein